MIARGRMLRVTRLDVIHCFRLWRARPLRPRPALIVRPSGTEPVIRVMGEGDDKALVEAAVDDLVEALTAGRGLKRRPSQVQPWIRRLIARFGTKADKSCILACDGLSANDPYRRFATAIPMMRSSCCETSLQVFSWARRA